MENSTASSKALPRKVTRGRRSTLVKHHSRNGAKRVPFLRRNAFPVLIGVTGMGCLLALLFSQRARMGGAGEMIHDGMNQVQDAIDAARQRMRVAAEVSYPKAQTLAAKVGSRVRGWIG